MNQDKNIQLHLGDCLEKMKSIPDGSVDFVLADLPYGTTACKWDNIIPFEPLWEQLHRVCKPNAAMCIFGSEPFSSKLRMSNLKHFKYDWIWIKNVSRGMAYAKFRPMQRHEVVSIFCKNKTKYIKQETYTQSEMVKNHCKKGYIKKGSTLSVHTPKMKPVNSPFKIKINPHTALYFDVINNRDKNKTHPTQKPIAILEYLIKTYTLEGETVLDPTMGSGSTGVACVNLNRKFIGIEKESNYFDIANERIRKQIAQSVIPIQV